MNAVANQTTPEQSASTTAPDARTRRAEYRMRARRVRALGPLDVRPAAEQALEAGRVARVAADRLAALLKMTTRPGPQADALAAAGLSGSEAAEALRALLPLGKALEQLAGVVQE